MHHSGLLSAYSFGLWGLGLLGSRLTTLFAAYAGSDLLR